MSACRHLPLSLIAVVLVCLNPVVSGGAGEAATYHIHPAGKDINPGTSRNKPWKTMDRANRQVFRPGDQLLLAGGQTFQGNLLLDAADAGTRGRPVMVGSYGTGRATIQAGLGYAVLVQNAGGIEVRDLPLVLVLDLNLDLDLEAKKPDGMMLTAGFARAYFGLKG